MLIMYFDFIPCCLSKVAHRMMIGYNLRCLKIIEYPIEDSSLPIEGEYTYDLLSDHYFRISSHNGNVMKSIFSGMTDE